MPMNTLRYHSRTPSLLITVAAVIPAMLIGAGLSSPSAQAGYTVTLLEQMSNVVATGSGRIDLTGLSRDSTFSTSAFINSTAPLIITGPPPPGGSVDEYIPITGTGIWGPGFGAAPDA